MGTLTVSRFFVLHVFMIPAFIFAFVAAHVFLFRKAGAAGPIQGEPAALERTTEPFYPRQVWFDVGFALVIIAVLGMLAHLIPMELGPKANPSDTQYIPRPEWYYIPAFQWLKYWHGSLAVVGILVVPTLVAFLFVALPFLDRRPERRPWKRPIAVSIYALVFIALGVLSGLSHRNDLRDPGVASQLSKQNAKVAEFMKSPFEPELAGSSLAASNVALANPLAAKGKDIFEQQACNACHGDNGIGTAAAPKLIGVAARYDPAKIEALLRHPTDKMTQGGMPAVELKDEDMKALIAYLQELK